MFRIVAINDDSQNEDEDEVQVSKEAEVIEPNLKCGISFGTKFF